MFAIQGRSSLEATYKNLIPIYCLVLTCFRSLILTKMDFRKSCPALTQNGVLTRREHLRELYPGRRGEGNPWERSAQAECVKVLYCLIDQQLDN